MFELIKGTSQPFQFFFLLGPERKGDHTNVQFMGSEREVNSNRTYVWNPDYHCRPWVLTEVPRQTVGSPHSRDTRGGTEFAAATQEHFDSTRVLGGGGKCPVTSVYRADELRQHKALSRALLMPPDLAPIPAAPFSSSVSVRADFTRHPLPELAQTPRAAPSACASATQSPPAHSFKVPCTWVVEQMSPFFPKPCPISPPSSRPVQWRSRLAEGWETRCLRSLASSGWHPAHGSQ